MRAGQGGPKVGQRWAKGRAKVGKGGQRWAKVGKGGANMGRKVWKGVALCHFFGQGGPKVGPRWGKGGPLEGATGGNSRQQQATGRSLPQKNFLASSKKHAKYPFLFFFHHVGLK